MYNIKINSLTENQLKKRQMNNLVGGATCGCACVYQDTYVNGPANQKGGQWSVGVLKTDQMVFLPEIVVKPQN